MPEMATAVTLKGNPITLTGNETKVGQRAPDCTLVAGDLSEVKLSSLLKGKKCILSVVPSLDTPVCDLQTKRFNQEAGKVSDVLILTISMDLPFAQKRWCGATGSNKVTTLSDYRYGAFGEAYGVLIKGLRLLARAVFIIDVGGTIQYKQIVPEIAQEPDYNSVLDALKKI